MENNITDATYSLSNKLDGFCTNSAALHEIATLYHDCWFKKPCYIENFFIILNLIIILNFILEFYMSKAPKHPTSEEDVLCIISVLIYAFIIARKCLSNNMTFIFFVMTQKGVLDRAYYVTVTPNNITHISPVRSP